MRISFTAFGEAKPGGSKTAFAFKRKDGSLGANVVDSCKTVKSWRHVVATAAREVYDGPLLDGPLSLTLVFHTPRPKAHFGKHGLKRTAPVHPTKRPDCLKLARAVEDSLSSVVYRDDSQIVQEILFKNYGEPARCEVTIVELERT